MTITERLLFARQKARTSHERIKRGLDRSPAPKKKNQEKKKKKGRDRKIFESEVTLSQTKQNNKRLAFPTFKKGLMLLRNGSRVGRQQPRRYL